MLRKRQLKLSLVLMVAPFVLMACGEEEVKEDVPVQEPVQEEEIDMEQFRVDGDRLADEPVLSSEERELRFIEQYEKIDRPIIMNTIRYLQDFDKKHAESFVGVRLITSNSDEDVRQEKLKEYRDNLGEPINEKTTQIFDIEEVYPYTEDDFSSYYETVINILQNEVLARTQTYEGIKDSIEQEDFDNIKGSGIVRGFQDAIDTEGGMLEQVRPYIQEMDKLVANIRVNHGLEMPKYTRVDDESEELKLEDVATYVEPEPMTVQEIKRIEPNMELYEEEPQEEPEESNESEQ